MKNIIDSIVIRISLNSKFYKSQIEEEEFKLKQTITLAEKKLGKINWDKYKNDISYQSQYVDELVNQASKIQFFIDKKNNKLIHKQKKIHLPPCQRSQNIIKWLCSEKNYKNIFEPIYSDMMYEYNLSLSNGQRVRAKYIVLMYYISLATTGAKHKLINIVTSAYKLYTATK